MEEWLRSGDTTFATSQITGDGAVRAAERSFSALHENRPAILTPSATYAMRCALQAVGVGAGDEVIVPALDWPATRAAVLSLGALCGTARVPADSLSLDARTLERAISPRTKAIVVAHLHGVVADMPAIRSAARDIPVIEDCAQALGSAADGRLAGTLSDISVFSFGPGKTIDVGEGGMICTKDRDLYEKALRRCAHPAGQLIAGNAAPDFDGLSIRPHPLAAVLLAVELRKWDRGKALRAHEETAASVAAFDGVRLIGRAGRRENASKCVPAVATPAGRAALEARFLVRESGAYDIRTMRPCGRGILLVRERTL
ncbi:MAG: aminotransferase class V-fold PLP-dependent enzyme [Clostridiales Family XIII bacterium]|jgi:dTDP-4-amino-4,6-dideoxygalactose transaminase|nr:aminotransferase class V-fold PLP-dependent enzyme [Clostridiales Family XIII bacterium]